MKKLLSEIGTPISREAAKNIIGGNDALQCDAGQKCGGPDDPKCPDCATCSYVWSTCVSSTCC